MPPPCHSANTPGACGAGAIMGSVNGTLPLVLVMLGPLLGRSSFYACSSVIDGNSAHLSPRFDKCKTENLFSCLPQRGKWAQRLQKHGHHSLKKARRPCR